MLPNGNVVMILVKRTLGLPLTIKLLKPIIQLGGEGVAILPRGADLGCGVKIGLLPNNAKKNYLWSLREFLRCLLALPFPIALNNGTLWQPHTKGGKDKYIYVYTTLSQGLPKEAGHKMCN